METLQDFAEKNAPFFGDIVFSKEPSKTSRGIQVGQRILRKEATSGTENNYSHVAFVLDSTTIIHATKGGGVDLITLKRFFTTPGLRFSVLRSPDSSFDRKEVGKGTFYHGQGYDTNFLSRFAIGNPKSGKQVCSTLAANMLNNFEFANIEVPDRISPNELLLELKNADWIDVSSRYSTWISSLERRGTLVDDLTEIHSENIDVIHRSLQNQRQVQLTLSRILKVLLETVRKFDLDPQLEQQIIEEINSLEEIEEIDFKFHDTDSLD